MLLSLKNKGVGFRSRMNWVGFLLVRINIVDSLLDCGIGGVGFRGVDWKVMRIEVVFRDMNLGEILRGRV